MRLLLHTAWRVFAERLETARIDPARSGALALIALFAGCTPANVPSVSKPEAQPGAVRSGDVDQLRAEVTRLQRQGRERDATPIAEQLLAADEAAFGKESTQVAATLCFVAPLYQSAGDPTRAEQLYLRALAIRQKALGRDDPAVAAVLSDLANLYRAHGEDARAEELYVRALKIREEAPGDNAAVALAQSDLARLYQDRRDYARAEELYGRALALSEKTGDAAAPGVATIASNLASLYFDRGDYARAAALYQRALALDEQARGQDHSDVATRLTNLALTYQKLGEYGKAETLYRRALAIDERALDPNHRDVATVLNNLASLLEARGEYAQAASLYQRALAIREKALGTDHVQVATILNNMAALDQSLGDYTQAELLYQRSLAIREKALSPDDPEVAASLNNLALLYEATGDYSRAESLYARALAINRKVFGDRHPDTEIVRGNIASLLLRQGNLGAAYSILKEGDWPAGLGSYYLAKRDYHSAHAQFLRAISGADHRGETRHLLPSYLGLGLALEGLGQDALAAESYRAAVDLIEEQRSALASVERAQFLGGAAGAGFKRTVAYERLVRTSAKLGDPDEALRWSEHTKARQLLEATAQGRIAPGLPAQLATQEDALVGRLGALYRQREETVGKNPALYADIAGQQLPEAKRNLDEFVAELRRQYPAYAAYKYPQPLGARELALRPGEALLEFAVTEDATFVWLIRDGHVVKFTTIPVGRTALERQIEEYRSLFHGIRHTSDLRSDVTQGKALYDLLVKDSLSACAPGDTLIVVPDGSLSLIPFEALVVDNGQHGATQVRYLGDAFPILYAQSATLLSDARSSHPSGINKERKLFVLADPVFDDTDSRWPSGQVRPNGSNPGARSANAASVRWPRLEATEKLVRLLQEHFGTESVASLTGPEASEGALRKQPLSDYLYLVFATHGVLGGPLPNIQEPALVLSGVGADPLNPRNDAYLTLSEVADLKLNAEVAALTACDTGVGDEVGGEGVMGMGWAFEYAGARNVLMSLWSVDQRSAVQLTGSFFTQLRNGLGPQEALRQARTDLRNEGYHHPFFWAPFILVGKG